MRVSKPNGPVVQSGMNGDSWSPVHMPSSHVKPKEAEVAGSNPARSTAAEPDPASLKEGNFKTLWELKKKGYADSTIEGYARKLRTLSKLCDLNCPESVRTAIARKNCGNAFKEALASAYDHYVKVNGLSWNKPLYRRQRNLPYIATTEQIVHACFSNVESQFEFRTIQPCEKLDT